MNRPVNGFQNILAKMLNQRPPAPPPARTPAPEPSPKSDLASAKVQKVVDKVISTDASVKQRDKAYTLMQDRFDLVAHRGGATGVDPARFEMNTIRTLTAEEIPTQFRPEVVAAVDQSIHDADLSINGVYLPGASAEQVLDAYQMVNDYVDAIGGLGDAGISAEALPARTSALLREEGIPTEASKVADYVEDALSGWDGMDVAQRHDAIVEASARLERRTANLDPDAAATVIGVAMEPLESRLGEIEASGSLLDMQLSNAWTSLATLADRVTGTARGDAVVHRLADTVLKNAGPANPSLLAPLREHGVGLGMYLRMAEVADARYGEGVSDVVLREIDSALSDYVSHGAKPAVEAFSEHTAELNWLLQNLGTRASPEMLKEVTQTYIDANPGWQDRFDTLQSGVVDEGAQLLQQIEALHNLPPGLQDAYGTSAKEHITSLLEGEESGFAIATAAGADPESIAGLDVPEMVGFADTLSLGNRGLGVIKSLATAHVQHNVLGSVANIDSSDPAALAAARSQIATLGESALAGAIGIDPKQLGDLETAVDELQRMVPRAGESLSQADVESRLTRLNGELDKLGAFHKSQPIGQVFRGIGVAAGVASLWGSATGFATDPTMEGAIKTLAGAAGLSTALGDLASGMGKISDSSAWGRFSANTGIARVLGTVGLALGMAGVVDSLVQGDLTQAGLGAASVGGGALAIFGTASWAGPVGLTIGLVAAAASFGVGIHRANEATAQLEAASRPFLESLGFDTEAAKILSDYSGDGFSSVGVLMEYGKTSGLDHEQTVEWINDLPGDQLKKLRDVLNHVADDLDGNYSDFPAKTKDNARYDDAAYEQVARGNVGHLLMGELPPQSANQLDAALDAMRIALPDSQPAKTSSNTSLSREAANALDGSEGAVEVLERYGEIRGLDSEQTLGWINSIPTAELERLGTVLEFTHEDLDGARLRETAPSDGRFDQIGVENNLGHLMSGDLVALSARQIDAVLHAYRVDVPYFFPE